jgi:hypothetical protein
MCDVVRRVLIPDPTAGESEIEQLCGGGGGERSNAGRAGTPIYRRASENFSRPTRGRPATNYRFCGGIGRAGRTTFSGPMQRVLRLRICRPPLFIFAATFARGDAGRSWRRWPAVLPAQSGPLPGRGDAARAGRRPWTHPSAKRCPQSGVQVGALWTLGCWAVALFSCSPLRGNKRPSSHLSHT